MKKTTKRLLIAFSMAALGATMLFAAAACGSNPDEGHEHDFVEGASTATCTEDGVIPYTCTDCGFYYEVKDEALGHDMHDVEAHTAENCQDVSYNAHRACSRCDYTEGKVFGEAGDHVMEDVAEKVPANCQETGYTAHKACKFGDFINEDYREYKGDHVYKDVAEKVPANCQETGHTAYRECEYGDFEDPAYEEYTGDHVRKHVDEKAPDCFINGYTAHDECEYCDWKSDDYEVLPAAHTWQTVDAEAPVDCHHTGHSEYRHCEKCGTDEGKTEIMGPHMTADDWEYDGAQHWHPIICEHNAQPVKANHTSGTCEDCHYNPNENTGDFTYETSGGNYVVTGLTDAGKGKADLVIPAKADGKNVVSIKNYAFQDETGIHTIVLPASITSLGIQVFKGCTGLTSIVIPSTITIIPQNTFLGCTQLASVTLRKGLTQIDAQAFAGTAALTQITLPETLTSIGQAAFRQSGLTEVTVPASVTAMGTYAFAECASLTKATVLGQITYHFGGWFDRCEALQELTLPFIGATATVDESTISTAFGYVFGITEPENESAYTAVEVEGYSNHYYIPNSLKKVTVLGGTISAGAFNGCSMLEQIIAASGVTVVETTFTDCTATFTQE